MASTYKKLFRIRITHNYYESRFTSDFSIVPLPQTQKLARQYKLVFRPVANGIDVLSLMTADNTPFMDLGDGNKLSFAMMLHNTDLLNVTRLPGNPIAKQAYHIENRPEVGTSIVSGEWSLITPKSNSFTYSRESEANEITLKSTGPFGATYTSEMLKQGDRFTSAFELNNMPEGKYILEATEDGQTKPAEAIYSSEILWKTRPFALIDIFTRQLSYDKLRSYFLRLDVKRVNWLYQVNLTKDYTGSSISIEDQRESPEVFFKLVGNTSQIKGKSLRFRAFQIDKPGHTALIAYSETPISDFKLIIEKNGTTTEIAGLPNPAINQGKTEMHINI